MKKLKKFLSKCTDILFLMAMWLGIIAFLVILFMWAGKAHIVFTW